MDYRMVTLNTTLLFSFFLFSISLGATPNFLVNNGGKILDIQETGGGLENCHSNYRIRVYVANLTTTPELCPIQQYTLPEEYPDMYVKITIGQNYNEAFPVETFCYDYTEENVAAGIPVFYWEKSISIAWQALECYEYSNTESSPTYEVAILQESHEYYPIHDYSSPRDIFSCEVFDWTCKDCKDLYGIDLDCSNTITIDPVETGPVLPNCSCHVWQLQNDKSEYYSDGIEQIEKGSLEGVKATPNPFSSNLNIESDIAFTNPVEWLIYDASGKLITQGVTGVSENQLFSRNIDTQKWPRGIYFIKLKSGQEVKNIRVIKSH